MFAAVVGQSWATAAHPFNLEVNGTDRIAAAHYPSIQIEMPGPGSNGSMQFTLYDPDASISVMEWDEVRFIEHAATRPILFGGFVQSVRYVAWAGPGRALVVTCVGYGILLDRKAVPEFPFDLGLLNNDAMRRLVPIVNRHGGLLTASAPSSPGPMDATYSIPNTSGYWAFATSDWISQTTAKTLRQIIEYVLANTQYWGGAVNEAASGSYWADSGRRVVVLPDLPADADATNLARQYDSGDVPGLTVDESGTLAVTDWDYEREDTDRLTSAYVQGADAGSTGWYRAAPLPRAGDLEVIVTDTSSTSAANIPVLGGSAVRQTEGSTARGSTTISSEVPLDIWPGRNIRTTSTGVSLSDADWRITGVNIAFASATHRTYSIAFGGNVPRPSMARRSGRHAPRPGRSF